MAILGPGSYSSGACHHLCFHLDIVVAQQLHHVLETPKLVANCCSHSPLLLLIIILLWLLPWPAWLMLFHQNSLRWW